MTAYRLLPIIALLFVAMGSIATKTEAAVQCGALDPQTKRPTQATLELNQDSVTSIAYKRDADPRTLLFRFKAGGCDLPTKLADPEIEVLPKQGVKEIPNGVVSLTRARSDGSEYSVRLSATPKNFDPGSYEGFIEIRAPYLATTRTPVSLSRSEDKLAWPIGIGALGGVAGLVWFLLLSTAKGATAQIKKRHYAIVFIAAALVGVASVWSSYVDQDVWSARDNGAAAAIAAFTGATTGTMLSALLVLWKQPPPKPG